MFGCLCDLIVERAVMLGVVVGSRRIDCLKLSRGDRVCYVDCGFLDGNIGVCVSFVDMGVCDYFDLCEPGSVDEVVGFVFGVRGFGVL